jgi:hypothetical protein
MNALAIRRGRVPMAIPMTFIIEAIKDDRRLTEIRSSAIAVSISAPTGDLLPGDG